MMDSVLSYFGQLFKYFPASSIAKYYSHFSWYIFLLFILFSLLSTIFFFNPCPSLFSSPFCIWKFLSALMIIFYVYVFLWCKLSNCLNNTLVFIS